MDGSRAVQIPSNLYLAIQDRLGSNFASVDQFVSYVLGEVLQDDSAPFDESERDMIQSRLKDLGYL